MRIEQKNIKSYLLLVLIYLIFSFLLKTFDYIEVDYINISDFFISLLYNFIVNSLLSVIIFPFYYIFSLKIPKTSIIISSIVLSGFFLLESSLVVYCHKTGELMGTEFLTRSFSEIYLTVKAVSSPILVFLLFTLIVSIFVFLGLFLQRYKDKIFKGKKISTIIFLILLICSPFVFALRYFTSFAESSANENFIVNKTYFAIYSSFAFQKNINYLNFNTIDGGFEISDSLLDEFVNEYPERQIDDKYYPLEYYNENFMDNLSPYFSESEKNPDVILIIAESFSHKLFYEHEDSITFTPFFDSLENESLYWKNCLSLCPRSFAAYPSIWASLPLGVSGFQFGKMPFHNSSIKIFDENKYNTTLFYGGDPSFENKKSFLEKNDVKYILDYTKIRTDKNSDDWGLFDSIVFNLMIDSLKNNTSPLFYSFVTLSTHDGLSLKNKETEEYYYDKIRQIIKDLPQDRQKFYLENIKRISAYYYFDACLRKFISDYLKIRKNTIFVIVGDHSLGAFSKDEISVYHVPLVIYSPLLKEKKVFPSIISQNDIIPSVMKLLEKKYDFKMPEKIHWLGNPLDTSSSFSSKQKMIFFDNSRILSRFIYENYYYIKGNNLENEKLYSFANENLELIVEDNDSIKEMMKKKMNLFTSINYYVYLNDKLYKYQKDDSKYKILDKYQHLNEISLINPDKNSSKIKDIYIYPFRRLITNNKYKKLKIDLALEIKFSKLAPEESTYPFIQFICTNLEKRVKNTSYINSSLNISKKDLIKNKYNFIRIEKEFNIEGQSNVELEIRLQKVFNEFLDGISPNNLKTTIKNINVEVSAY